MKLIKGLASVGASVLLGANCLSAVTEDIARDAKSDAQINEVQQPVKESVEQVVENKVEENAEAKKVFSEKQQADFLKTYGWVTFMQSGVKSLGLNEKEIEQVLNGVQMAARGEESPCALGEVMEDLQSFLQQKSSDYAKIHQAEVKIIADKNRQAGKAFMENLLKTKPSIKTTASGLSYEIITMGDEKQKPSEMDSVEIKYAGRLIDGKVFDESKDKTVTFPLNGVVPGIKEGAQLIGKGGKITLYIPAELGYGEFDIPSIPAGSHLIFDIELINVIKNEPEKVNLPTEDKTSVEKNR